MQAEEFGVPDGIRTTCLHHECGVVLGH